jgi:hypothetical protein
MAIASKEERWEMATRPEGLKEKRENQRKEMLP